MAKLKTPKNLIVPDVENLPIPSIREVLKQLLFELDSTHKKVHSDLASINTESHDQNKDQYLDYGGGNQVAVADAKDAVAKKHTQGTDQYLDEGGASQVAVADAKDAVDKKHTQNADTALGTQSEDLNMGTHKIVGVVDPVSDQQAATKKYVDDNIGAASNVIFAWSGNENYAAGDYGIHYGTELDADPTTAAIGYLYFVNETTTYRTFLHFKFQKTTGVETVTIHARLKVNTFTVYLNVDIGGQSGVLSETQNAFAWANTATVDVSGLTDGTVYDGIVQLKVSNATSKGICSAVTLIGS